MSVTAEPIWAASVDDPWWDFCWHARPEWNRRVLDWMRAEGVDPAVVYGLEVYLVDALHAEVAAYVTDEHGRYQIDPSDPDRVWTRTYTRMLSSYPPEWPQVTDA